MATRIVTCCACGAKWTPPGDGTLGSCPLCYAIALPHTTAGRERRHTTNITGKEAGMGTESGVKLDTGKPRMDLVIEGFPRALLEVGKVAGFGAAKYTEHGWLTVPDGKRRYQSAAVRHILAEAKGDKPASVDEESGLLHLAHAAWNALAVLELALQEQDGR